MKRLGRGLFGMVLLAVLILGLSATAPETQGFEYFETCPTNACIYISPLSTAGICDAPTGEVCLVRREGPFGTICLGDCF